MGTAYTLERELNAGGMSRVFVAEEISLGRRVVVKVIAPGTGGGISVSRFQREIAVAAQLQHPHVVPVLTTGQMADGLPYYTMPFIDGASLRVRLDAGLLPLGEAVNILRDVAEALAYAHECGVVHRDIKPENVLLSRGAAVVTDFGIAKALDGAVIGRSATDGSATITHIGIALGTPRYMAPEQIAGDPAIDHHADLYALGIVAYEMLAGRHPFTDLTGHELMAAHLSAAPTPLERVRPDVPPSLAALVAQLLQKRPADRPPSAAEVLQRLESVMPAVDPAARHRDALAEHARTSRERRRFVAATAFLSLAAAATLAGHVTLARMPVPASQRGGAQHADVAPPGIKSVAVLPFVNIGGDARDEYFSDGMTDELMSRLGKVEGLRVAGRSSAYSFKGKREDTRRVGTQLQVAAVLQGSVRRAGSKLRVSAQLVKSSDGLTLWSETYEREMEDVFQVQDELARAIVGALRVELGTASDAVLAHRPTADLHAYDLYLKGRYAWNRRTATSLERAARYFEQAIARDPGFAQAHAGLADTYLLLPRYGSVAPSRAWPKARAEAERALALDSALGEAHASLAFGKMVYDRDDEGAGRGFRRALALSPSYATAHQWYGDYLVGRGHAEEGSRELLRAQELDPLSPIIASELGWSLYVSRRYEEAIAQLQQTLQLDPDFALAHFWLGVSYLGKRMRPDAIKELQRAVDLSGRNAEDLATLGYARAVSGDGDGAEELLSELLERASSEVVAASVFAIIYVGLGDNARAFASLNKAADERDTRLADLLIDPRLDPLRADARFAQLRERMRSR